MSLASYAKLFADEEKAIAFVEKMMWPNGPVCPHCENTAQEKKIYELKGETTRAGLRKCGACRKTFTVRVGTIFEDSHIPLSKWLFAIYLMSSSKKGVSAAQLQRELEISYKAAWFMCHRVRMAMTQPPLIGKLGMGGKTVEVDETFIGGKHRNNRRKPYGGTGFAQKQGVMTIIERDGLVRTFKIPNTKTGTLEGVARMNIDSTAHIMTDAHSGYRNLGKHFASHEAVDHDKTMVRGVVHTNFAESYHSLLKRGILGTYHHVSTEHLGRYLREFEFRWNSRKVTDSERTELAIKGAKGKRLTYRQPLKQD